MGISSYLRCLVIKEDQAKMNELEAPCMLNEAQHALNRASVLHHETFLRYREELKHHEVETRELTEKRDTYKLLSEKLQAGLEAAQKEHADLVEQVRRVFEVSDDESDTVANDPNPQETGRAQLASVEVQLQAAKEKTSVQAKKIEELQSQLNSIVSVQENLAKDLEAAKSEVVMVRAEANDRMAGHKDDAEVAQDQERNMVKNAKWKSRRDALEGVHAQNFDLLAEIENAKIYEAKSRKLAYPQEEDSEGS
ncbi:interactor of constitutive active ROPs 3-like [Nicotiana tomentosiformis]|uniref:interactor of constitutive active ROPs 3-like n=1 Tax=Nicotiana tomentosiformis TaxID=4098 RepID=UPI00388C8BB8